MLTTQEIVEVAKTCTIEKATDQFGIMNIRNGNDVYMTNGIGVSEYYGNEVMKVTESIILAAYEMLK